MSTPKKPKAPSADDLSLEESMARLEKLVDSMESGDIPLDRLVAQYEEGMRLIQACEAKLGDAELRIEQLGGDGETA